VGYDAFISYSHAADGRLAPQLQSGLQRFAKPWWRRRALHVFRDETGLSANPHLWASIEEALAASAWFVFLASPEAARSEWVHRELSWWIANRDPNRILPVLTDGSLVWDPRADRLDTTATDAVPAVLAETWTAEPRWIDLRWARDSHHLDLRDVRFRDAVADIAAPLHGVPKDDLASEEVRQHRRTVRTVVGAAGVLAVLAVVAVVAGVLAIGQRNEAQDQARIASARAVAAQAAANAPVRTDRALLLGAHAVGLHDDADTRSGLLTALDAAGSLVAYRRELGGVDSLMVSEDGGTVVTVTAAGALRTWDTSTWELRAETTTEELDDPVYVQLVDDDDAVAVYALNGAQVFRTDTLEPVSPVFGADAATTAVSDGGERYATAGPEGTTVVVAEVATGEELELIEIPEDCAVVYFLNLLDRADGLVHVSCVSGRQLLFPLGTQDDSPPIELAIRFLPAGSGFSPDGSLMVLSGYAGELALVDTRTGALVAGAQMPSERIYSSAFDATGRYLATGGDNGIVAVWEIPEPDAPPLLTRVAELPGLEEGVVGIGFLPPEEPTEEELALASVGFPPAPGWLVVGTASAVSVWDPAQRTVIAESIGVPDDGYLVADGDRRAVVAGAGPDPASSVLRVLSIADGSTLRTIDVTDGDPILAAVVSADGERVLLAAGVGDGFRLLVVAVADGTVEQEVVPADAASWNPDNRRDFGSLWINWSPDGRWVTFLGHAGGIGIGDLTTGEASEIELDEPPYAAGWSSAGELVVGGLFGTLTFVDPATGRTTAENPTLAGFSIADIETGPDGLLVVTSESGEVWLVDPVTREPVGEPFRWGGTQLQHGAVNPDGTVVAALSRDGTLRLWDRATRRPLAAALAAFDGVRSGGEVEFLADGTLVTIDNLELLRWELDSTRLVATACRLAARDLTEDEWRSYIDADGTPSPVCP
jgi:WD40 repeat protein